MNQPSSKAKFQKANQPTQPATIQQQVAFTQHIGPIPDPDTLGRYNEVNPGFAERIVTMAEKEQLHRHENDVTVLNNQEKQHKRNTNTFRLGQYLALISVLLIVGLCLYCLILGYPTQAATIACSVIVGLAAVFIMNKTSVKKTPEQNL